LVSVKVFILKFLLTSTGLYAFSFATSNELTNLKVTHNI